MEYTPLPFGQHVINPMFDIGFKPIFGREKVIRKRTNAQNRLEGWIWNPLQDIPAFQLIN